MDKQENRRYPIGRFEYGKTYSISDTKKNIKILEQLPKQLKKMLKKASKSELNKPYRQGGWTVRQVIHHLSDSHINAYIRMKMAVTEHFPIIKPYDEQAWASLESGKTAPVQDSIKLLKVIHTKWIDFIHALTDADLKKGYVHPTMNRTLLLPESIALYAWHSQHHLAHIKLVISGKETKEPKEEQVSIKFEPAAIEPKPAPEIKRGRPTLSKTTSDAPKLSRAEILQTAKDANNANKAQKPKPAATAPKPSRAESLTNARAAKDANNANKAQKPKPASDAPKLSRAEILANARAAKAAKSASDTTEKAPKSKKA